MRGEIECANGAQHLQLPEGIGTRGGVRGPQNDRLAASACDDFVVWRNGDGVDLEVVLEGANVGGVREGPDSARFVAASGEQEGPVARECEGKDRTRMPFEGS